MEMKFNLDWLDMEYFFGIKKNKNILKKKSKYQKIEIFENKQFGRILRLDDSLQTSEKDEYMYHEPMAHIPLLTHPNPKNVLIIGGGDFGLLKQVLKHKIKKVDMVELDGEVVEVTKKYLKKIHENCYNDKRVTLKIEDGFKYLENTKEKYDVIILDLTDPYYSLKLYSNNFYKIVKNKLNKGGVVTLHAEAPYMDEELHIQILKTLMKSFKIVQPFYNYVPLYGSVLGFAYCSEIRNAKKISIKEIDKRIKERKIKDLKLMDGERFTAMLVVPIRIQKGLKNNKIKILTEKSKLKDYKLRDELFSKPSSISMKDNELIIS